jgi:hypothetical protein
MARVDRLASLPHEHHDHGKHAKDGHQHGDGTGDGVVRKRQHSRYCGGGCRAGNHPEGGGVLRLGFFWRGWSAGRRIVGMSDREPDKYIEVTQEQFRQGWVSREEELAEIIPYEPRDTLLRDRNVRPVDPASLIEVTNPAWLIWAVRQIPRHMLPLTVRR